jgi:hypothetical protein
LPYPSPAVSIVPACPPDGSPEDQLTLDVEWTTCVQRASTCRTRNSKCEAGGRGRAPRRRRRRMMLRTPPARRTLPKAPHLPDPPPVLHFRRARPWGKRPPPVAGVTQSADDGFFSFSIKPPTPTPTYVDVYWYSNVERVLTDLSLLVSLRRGRRGRQDLPSRLRLGEGLVICSAQSRNVALDYTRQAMRSEGRAPLARRLYIRESGARMIIIDQHRQSTASRNLSPPEDNSAGSLPLSRVHSHARAPSREAYAGNVLASPSSCSTAFQNPTTGSAGTARVPDDQNVSTSEVH